MNWFAPPEDRRRRSVLDFPGGHERTAVEGLSAELADLRGSAAVPPSDPVAGRDARRVPDDPVERGE